MDLLTLAGLGLVGYYIYTKLNKLEAGLEQSKQDFDEYIDEQEQEEIDPAEKYLQITPEVIFNEVTGNEWTGIIKWNIKNTSNNFTFNITRIKSNISINGHTSLFVAGNRDSIRRLDPNSSTTIAATWQDKRWFNASDVVAKNDIRAILRAEMDVPHPILECDITLWVRGSGQAEEQKVMFHNVHGTVMLESGAKSYWTNQGEYAGDWVGFIGK